MLEYAEHFLIQRILGYSVMMIKSGLCSPTDIKGGCDMRTRPIEYFHYFIPVSHFFEIQLFYRSTGDNHTVVLLTTHLFKVSIERLHMFYRRILGCMTLDFHERDFHLKRCIGEQTHKICLRGNLQRHQVQDNDAQRADVLLRGAGVVNNKYVLFFQQLYRRQLIR